MNHLFSYCQRHGLRILAIHAFKFFLKYLRHVPGNYLEIGVFEGFMLRELAHKFPQKMFFGIDPFIEDGHTSDHNGGVPMGATTTEQMKIAHRNLEKVMNVRLFKETSRSFFDRTSNLDLRKMNLSAVFIDGDHSYEEARNDMFNAARAIPNGGVIFIDDLDLPDVKRAADEFITSQCNRLIGENKGILFFK